MPKSPSIRNSKRRGEWAELRFMAEAVQRGFNVMRPWGESARYDVLLERNLRYLRVQVKSTQYKIGKAYVCGLRSDNKFNPIAAPRSTSSRPTSSPRMSGTSCPH